MMAKTLCNTHTNSQKQQISTGQLVVAGIFHLEVRILLEQYFIAQMPFLMAISAYMD